LWGGMVSCAPVANRRLLTDLQGVRAGYQPAAGCQPAYRTSGLENPATVFDTLAMHRAQVHGTNHRHSSCFRFGTVDDKPHPIIVGSALLRAAL
jgi:hypothetical protein